MAAQCGREGKLEPPRGPKTVFVHPDGRVK
jgi:hypothetical protein